MLGERESIKKSVLSSQGSVKRATCTAVKVGTGYVPAQPKTFLEGFLAKEHPPSSTVFSTQSLLRTSTAFIRAIARGTAPAQRAFRGPVTTENMRMMKIQTAVHLMRLLILVLQFASLTNGVFSYFILILTVEENDCDYERWDAWTVQDPWLLNLKNCNGIKTIQKAVGKEGYFKLFYCIRVFEHFPFHLIRFFRLTLMLILCIHS